MTGCIARSSVRADDTPPLPCRRQPISSSTRPSVTRAGQFCAMLGRQVDFGRIQVDSAGRHPMLLIGAVDVLSGRFRTFSSRRDRITAAMERPSLYESFLAYAGLAGRPPAEVQDGLVDVYRTDAARAQVCERMVDIDEGIQEWRYRHVKMVERTIGAKIGTGGSAGALYLRETIGRPIFPDLWEIRSKL